MKFVLRFSLRFRVHEVWGLGFKFRADDINFMSPGVSEVWVYGFHPGSSVIYETANL